MKKSLIFLCFILLLTTNVSAHTFSKSFTNVTINNDMTIIEFKIDSISVQELLETEAEINESFIDYNTREISELVTQKLIFKQEEIPIHYDVKNISSDGEYI